MSLSLVWSERSIDHEPPRGHPERVERGTVMRRVVEAWRERGGVVLAAEPAAMAAIHAIHDPGYTSRLAASEGTATALDLDTFTSPGSWPAAVAAAGAAVMAVDAVIGATPEAGTAGGDPATVDAAFALVRPPGHHALRDRAMGFCLLNNAAIAAAHALGRGLSRVAVFDFDVHHGNGTQWAFYDDPRVLVMSVHQYPHYPGTGAAGECGVGPGEGSTLNVPMAAGATDGDYLLVLDRIVEPVLAAWRPDLLLVDAGFDAHAADPLANMRLTTGGFAAMADRLRQAALRWCRGRVALVTEGGYELDALAASLQATVDVFAGSAPPSASSGGATEIGRAAVDLALAAQRRYWSTL